MDKHFSTSLPHLNADWQNYPQNKSKNKRDGHLFQIGITTHFMNNADLTQLLLDWYDQNGRELPWRVKGGAHPDPYIILVSEFMLQQTTVKTVIPYFERFINRFPTIQSLANASLEDVYNLWQGLGYYTRARSLHTTVNQIVKAGHFPQTREDVLKLKGIGAYTASSFLALAFNQPQTVVDGNVIRIICRMYHFQEPVAQISDIIHTKAAALTSREHPADYASAIMDLGAMICTPQNPQCLLCPWQTACLSKNSTNLKNIPNRSKPAKKEKQGYVYIVIGNSGKIFIRKRTEKGLLHGLYEFPWTDNTDTSPIAGAIDSGLKVSHTFTHFRLILQIFIIPEQKYTCINGKMAAPSEFDNYPFSTLMKKVWLKIAPRLK